MSSEVRTGERIMELVNKTVIAPFLVKLWEIGVAIFV